MKTIILYISLMLPVLLQAGQLNKNIDPANTDSYRVWVYDRSGEKIASGLLHSVSESSVILYEVNSIVIHSWKDFDKKTISVSDIGHIEYRPSREMNRQSRKTAGKAFWISTLSSFSAAVIALTTSGGLDFYGGVSVLVALQGVITYIGLPFALIGGLCSLNGKKYRQKIFRKKGKLDLNKLLSEQE